MRLTPAHAAQLLRLANGGSLPKSRLAKMLLVPLQEAGAVRLEKSGASYLVRGIPSKLNVFVQHQWGIRDLRGYAETGPENRSRERLTEIAGDSKALPSQPFDGIFLRSFGECFLGDQPLGITPQGSAVLISLGELPRLRVQAKFMIGIENVECLWNFEKSLRHFPQLENVQFTLILRWHWSVAWRLWLNGWKGEMFYFPDYDPAGLSIFTTEVLPYRKDARLLVPRDFESLLNVRGDRNLFVRHEKYLSSSIDQAETASVLKCLKKLRKALEQEALLY